MIKPPTKLVDVIADEILAEFRSALDQNSKFNSHHEGYAVILEELDELWDEVKKKREHRSHSRCRKEAVQVAAMAFRFIYDLS